MVQKVVISLTRKRQNKEPSGPVGLTVVYPGDEPYPLGNKIEAPPLQLFGEHQELSTAQSQTAICSRPA